MDTTKLSFTGYWRADYPGTTWPATASAGVSGTTGALTATGFGAPATGTAQNGRTPADFSGGQALTNAILMSSLFAASGNAGTIVGVYNARALAVADPNVYLDPQLWADSVGVMGLSLTASGLVGWLFDGVYKQTAGILYGTGSYNAFRMRWDGSTLGITLNNGTETTVACGAQTNLTGDLLIGENYSGAGTIDGLMLEIGMLDTTMPNRTWNDYGIYAQERYALSLGFVPPLSLFQVPASLERTERRRTHAARQYAFQSRSMVTSSSVPTFFQPHYAERVDRGQVARAGMAAARMPVVPTLAPSPLPVVTTTFAQNRALFTDKIENSDRRRSNASRIPSTFAPAPSPLPVVTTTFAHGRATYPDRIPRVGYPAHQQDSSELPPLQQVSSFTMQTGLVSAPDRLPRVPSRQDWSSSSSQPERTLPLADVEFPERIPRPVFHPARPGHMSLAPQPERTAPIEWVECPSRVPRPALHATQQLHVTQLSPQPERTAPIESTSYPDRVTRPWFAPSQNAATYLSPQPERTAPIEWAEYPSRVLRPTLGAVQQLPATAVPAQPERTSTLADVRFQDRVPRPTFRVDHQVHVTSIAPQPEQTVALSSVTYPDRVVRPSLAPAHQLATTAVSPLPLPTAALTQIQVGYASYPDRVVRPSFAAGSQQAAAFWPLPIPVDTTALAFGLTTYPDRLPRATSHATGTWLTRDPAPVVVQTSIVPATYPDRVTRPIAQHAPFAMASQPERTAPIASVIAPDRLDRPRSPRLEVFFAPQPERTAPIAATTYPDRVDRPRTNPAHVSFVTSMPERTAPIAVAVYPDAVARARPAPHTFIASVPRVAPVVVPIYAAATFPHRFWSPPRVALLGDSFAWSIVRGSYITVAFNADGIARTLSQEAFSITLSSQAVSRTTVSEGESHDLSELSVARIIEDE